MFVFWELVGLCSYLLIGFYFDRAYASRAAIKAFVTNRVGDFGFLIGLMLVFFKLGTFDLDQAAANFAHQFATNTGIFGAGITLFGYQISGMGLATLMGIGLFCGAMGKSAQFPLHVWLPDAMAGPTPVSALIHAATMVAAGVYLVARVFRLMTPDALLFVAVIGCLTLTLMALIAIVQVDIKKCLAYSTLSQLGYMIFGMGCGAWIAALFHLMTHAFFKAMLFLCSGQVIEGCHHEQDMRKMGGLRKKMPFTCWTFFVGVLAISGAGIAGTSFGLGGFFSKDEILAVAYARSHEWTEARNFEEGHHDAGHGTEATGHDEHASALPAIGERQVLLVAHQQQHERPDPAEHRLGEPAAHGTGADHEPERCRTRAGLGSRHGRWTPCAGDRHPRRPPKHLRVARSPAAQVDVLPRADHGLRHAVLHDAVLVDDLHGQAPQRRRSTTTPTRSPLMYVPLVGAVAIGTHHRELPGSSAR